jgi:hypothetical protein
MFYAQSHIDFRSSYSTLPSMGSGAVSALAKDSPITTRASESSSTTSHQLPGLKDRQNAAADAMERGRTMLANNNLVKWQPPPGTQVIENRFNMAAANRSEKWVPMQHEKFSSVYNPVTHVRDEFLMRKSGGNSDSGSLSNTRTVQIGDETWQMHRVTRAARNEPDGNYRSCAEQMLYNKTAFNRAKGVTEFVDRTHCFKPNFNETHANAMHSNAKIFARQRGGMVAWMDAAIQGKTKIPFRKTQPQ